ncbi:hypothetical protein GCM10009734_65570 [Nonomuraea bangladeshensis]
MYSTRSAQRSYSCQDAGPQQDDVTHGERLPAGERVVRAGARDDDRHLQEAVGVCRIGLFMDVPSRVGERPVGEVDESTDVLNGRYVHAGTIALTGASC